MNQFKNVKVLTAAAMLAAIAVVLGFFKIPLTPTIEIRFAQIPIAIASGLFGPFVGAIVGVVSDIGGYILKPTGPFFPGFTISAALSGVIFGLFLYKKPFTLPRIALAMLVKTILVGLFLNSWWLSILYKKGFAILVGGRIVKEMVLLPIFILLLYFLLKFIEKSGVWKRNTDKGM